MNDIPGIDRPDKRERFVYHATRTVAMVLFAVVVLLIVCGMLVGAGFLLGLIVNGFIHGMRA